MPHIDRTVPCMHRIDPIHQTQAIGRIQQVFRSRIEHLPRSQQLPRGFEMQDTCQPKVTRMLGEAISTRWRQRRVDWERAGRQDSALADDGRGAGVGVGAASCVELIVEGGWYWKRGLKGGAGWGRVELVI